MNRLARALAAGTALAGAAGCGVVGGGRGGSYELTVDLPRAVSLYEESAVLVMGLRVGEVRELELEPDGVRVVLAIDEDVPVPDDVIASVVPRSFIGERNVVLHPAWREGQPRAEDGDVIPEERVELPVEVDDALAAVDELVSTLDREAVAELVSSAAGALDGRGEALNTAIGQLSGLSQLLAREDDTMVAIGDQFADLAGALNAQGDDLGQVIDAFGQATGVLAAERADLEVLLASLTQLGASTSSLVEAHGERLQTDLARLARAALSLQTNVESFTSGLAGAGLLQSGLASTYRADSGQIVVRVALPAASVGVMGPLYEALGLGIDTCQPGTPGLQCHPGGASGELPA